MSDELTTLPCVGGPLDGQQVTVRTPAGFLAADKAAGLAWIYKAIGRRFQVCLDHDDSLRYPDGPTTGARYLDKDRAVEAAIGPDLDVIAVDTRDGR